MGEVNNILNISQEKYKAILLDVAGTISSSQFVKDVLFKYNEEHVEEYLKTHWEDEKVKDAVKELNKDKKLDVADAVATFKQFSKEVSSNIGLKNIQGMITREGCESGALKIHIFKDAVTAMESWAKLFKVAIYSTGSVESQKVLLSHSAEGDITTHINKYFDQNIGAKTESDSYVKIATELEVKPEEMVFVTDLAKEAVAAKKANVTAVLVDREGNDEIEEKYREEFTVVTTFDNIKFESGKRKNEEVEEPEAPPSKVAKKEVTEEKVEAETAESAKQTEKGVPEAEAMEVDVCDESPPKETPKTESLPETSVDGEAVTETEMETEKTVTDGETTTEKTVAVSETTTGKTVAESKTTEETVADSKTTTEKSIAENETTSEKSVPENETATEKTVTEIEKITEKAVAESKTSIEKSVAENEVTTEKPVAVSELTAENGMVSEETSAGEKTDEKANPKTDIEEIVPVTEENSKMETEEAQKEKVEDQQKPESTSDATDATETVPETNEIVKEAEEIESEKMEETPKEDNKETEVTKHEETEVDITKKEEKTEVKEPESVGENGDSKVDDSEKCEKTEENLVEKVDEKEKENSSVLANGVTEAEKETNGSGEIKAGENGVDKVEGDAEIKVKKLEESEDKAVGVEA